MSQHFALSAVIFVVCVAVLQKAMMANRQSLDLKLKVPYFLLISGSIYGCYAALGATKGGNIDSVFGVCFLAAALVVFQPSKTLPSRRDIVEDRILDGMQPKR